MNDIRRELVGFWKKLGAMLKSGVPVLQSLAVLKEEASDERIRDMLQELRDRLDLWPGVDDHAAVR